ncbi:hypothetical protein Ark11_1516 [Candidatus Ichthyocystis hellenicum]|uniref:Uncharacterized protein n=1 Tax=Candidatus Ichthyocystis hellenicum TaxID=1561003 RepID=A0A0S4M6G7_9BURK|nr:hypothetical protein Ark11_1516 [Candidatus Ichthyocystis hellenicum]
MITIIVFPELNLLQDKMYVFPLKKASKMLVTNLSKMLLNIQSKKHLPTNLAITAA